jgi:4'-phosphopantetheinyl transferase
MDLVTPSRRERAARYRLLPDRLRSLAAGLLMRRYLGVRSDSDLLTGPMGRPELARPGPSFSISHAGEFAALAVTYAGPVGLDVEPLSRTVRRGLVADRAFSPEERSLLQDCPEDPLPFLAVWTRRESLVKAAGLGLFNGGGQFSVVPLDAPRLHAMGTLWAVATRTVEGHVFSVAAPSADGSELECDILETSAEELLD